jgi:diacylglycerol kinase family enzyme
MKPIVHILINPYSHQGKGWKRWQLVKDKVLAELGEARELICEKGIALSQLLPSFDDDRQHVIISAGGDGSMNYLCNFLLREIPGAIPRIRIGAIGLGSSNDFLKPFQRSIHNIPLRINLARPGYWQDAGLATYIDNQNKTGQKYFIVNASFGATAQGNWNFNHPGPVLKFLKRTHTGLAIQYTSMSTILGFRNKSCTILYNNQQQKISLSNINILKIPFVAGSLRYDQPISPDDERFGLNICKDMNRLELIKTLLDLSKGKFEGNDKKHSGYVNEFELSADSPIVFECDGETEKVSRVQIKLLPRALQFLSY